MRLWRSPSDGHLTCSPGPDASASNRVQVQVRDDGNPLLESWTWVTVLAGGPPLFSAGQPQVSGGLFQLQFSTLPGETYQVEYSEALSNPLRLPLGSPFVAQVMSRTVGDALAGICQRFYHVKVLNP